MNRHLYGDMLPVAVDVCDYVKVSAGDLMLLCEPGRNNHLTLQAGLRGHSGITGYGYPWSSGTTIVGSLLGGVTTPFLGIALDDSPEGTTSTISVATAGVFELPLQGRAGVTVGRVVQALKPTGWDREATTTASYKVILDTAGSAVTVGYCIKTESTASGASPSTVRVLLRTKYGPGGIVENT